MPAALDIDREAVRVLVVAIGPRAAARELGLPEDTVRQWSSRFGWVRQAEEMRAKAGAASRERAAARGELSPIVTKSPAQAMGDVLQDLDKRTRIGFARASAKVAEEAETQDVAALLENADSYGKWAKTAALAHGWAGAGSSVTNVAVNLLSQNVVQWDEA